MPSNSNPHQGEVISLACIASGIPTPNIMWTKNNVTLTNTDRIAIATTGHESRLQIAGLLPEDSGVYVCVATSITGEARDQTSIEVIGKFIHSCMYTPEIHSSMSISI